MNNLQKTILYPIVSTGVIILITCLDWFLTAFFSIIFDTTLANVAYSPMMFIYIISGIVTLYMIIFCCQYIDEKL